MTDIALRNETLISGVDDIARLAKMVAGSGLFQDARDIEKAGVKLLAGHGLGITPFEALTGIHVVQGKPQMSSTLIGALIKRSGRYDYRVVTLDDTMCVIRFSQNGEESGTSMFTMDDAKRAGLTKNDTWSKYPQPMLYSRALSKGARMFCPDVFGGAVYAEGEIADDGSVPEQPQLDNGDAIAREAEIVLDATEITDEETK